ncbi:MAG: DNA polymerase III subunit gamma/tau [Cyanobacteria bacterium J06588_4]
MAYEPLHHKYRPQTFKDLVGQETIALTLSNALEQARIAPAYLFTGPRGTGKTSSARILAKSLNCLASDRPTPYPCGKCEACLAIARGTALDVMEIDAASNTGVDNIREIIERSRFAPVQCRYKIYAIDECHMLSTAAFNALLKTLEEPPPQVVFILATTDPQRVLSTIISRCQRFDYRRIPLTEMTGHLRYIADREAIAIADDALTLVAQISNGGLRDAESLLDQLSLLPETITVSKVWDLVGAVPEQDLLGLLRAINSNDSLAVLQQCRSLLDRGREPLVVLQNLATFYLNLLIAKTAPQHSELTAVTETCWQELCAEGQNWQTGLILQGQQHLKEAETQLKRTTQPRLWLEVTLLGLLPEANRAIAIQKQSSITAQPQTVLPTSPQQIVTPLPTVVITPPAPPPDVKAVSTNTTETSRVPAGDFATPPTVSASPSTGSQNSKPPINDSDSAAAESSIAPTTSQDPVANQQIWSKVVSCLHPPTTQALLKQQCHLVSFDGMSAIVGVSSAKLQKMTQLKIPNIEAAFAQVLQRKVRVQLEVASSKKKLTNNSVDSTIPIDQRTKANTSNIPPQFSAPPPPVTSQTNIEPSTDTMTAPVDNMPSQAVASARSISNPVTAKPFNQNSNFHHHSPTIAHQTETASTKPASVLTSTAAIPPVPNTNHAVLNDSSVLSGESTLEPDDTDCDLQQAISSLTQSFEGEVVQLENEPDLFFADVEDSTESEEVTRSDRPNSAEYDDDW